MWKTRSALSGSRSLQQTMRCASTHDLTDDVVYRDEGCARLSTYSMKRDESSWHSSVVGCLVGDNRRLRTALDSIRDAHSRMTRASRTVWKQGHGKVGMMPKGRLKDIVERDASQACVQRKCKGCATHSNATEAVRRGRYVRHRVCRCVGSGNVSYTSHTVVANVFLERTYGRDVVGCPGM